MKTEELIEKLKRYPGHEVVIHEQQLGPMRSEWYGFKSRIEVWETNDGTVTLQKILNIELEQQ